MTYLSTDEAAKVFGISTIALRNRIRRAVYKMDGQLRARLGDGWIAVRFGRKWSVRREEPRDRPAPPCRDPWAAAKARFLDKIYGIMRRAGNDGCWPFPGRKTQTGYRTLMVSGKRELAHRASYRFLVGEIPEGLVIDHKCRNRACCNPGHLEPVTNRENSERGAAPTIIANHTGICCRGHVVEGANASVRSGTNRVRCRACIALRRERSAGGEAFA